MIYYEKFGLFDYDGNILDHTIAEFGNYKIQRLIYSDKIMYVVSDNSDILKFIEQPMGSRIKESHCYFDQLFALILLDRIVSHYCSYQYYPYKYPKMVSNDEYGDLITNYSTTNKIVDAILEGKVTGYEISLEWTMYINSHSILIDKKGDS